MCKLRLLFIIIAFVGFLFVHGAPLQEVVCNHDGSSCVTLLNATEEISAKEALYDTDKDEGDMIFPQTKTAVAQKSKLWPSGVVPFSIDSSLRNIEPLIMRAIKQFESSTCIRFVPRSSEYNYVHMFNGVGCYSNVGLTSGRQTLSLGRGCNNIGTAVHELGHAIGLYHEQNRSDRNEYLQIYWDNISTAMRSQFKMLPSRQNILYNGFDYKSIMIYGERAFSKDGYSRTMSALKTRERLTDPYNKPGLSQSDIYRINRLYNCGTYRG